MTIGDGLRAHLLSSTAWQGETLGVEIAAIVGTQVFPTVLPQNILKSPSDTTGAITWARVSSIRGSHLRGADGLARPRVQIDAWARTQDRASALGGLIRRRLHGFVGEWALGGSPVTTTRVTILFDTEADMVDEEINGGLGRHSADYFLFHSTAGGVL